MQKRVIQNINSSVNVIHYHLTINLFTILYGVNVKFSLSLIALSLVAHQTMAQDAQSDIEKIEVSGKYLASDVSNSVKTPTPIIDVPQSLSVLTAEQLSQRGISNIGQIIDYLPGVNTTQGEGHRDAIVFRGVRSTADFYIDGHRDDVQYYRSLYNIEQVEVLRGPNALLFGRGGTGGILNRVSKKAQLSDRFAGYNLSLDSFGGTSTHLDVNQSVSDAMAFRVNAMFETLESHRDFYDGERIGINPTVRFVLSDATTLDTSFEYIDHERFIDRGIPTNSYGRPAEELLDIVIADPQNNYHTTKGRTFNTALQHYFSDSMKANVSVFYGTYDKVYANFYATAYDANESKVQLDGYLDETTRENLIITSNLVNEFTTGGFEHTLIVGGEYIETESDQYRFNPVWSSNQSDKEWFSVSRPLNLDGFVGVNAEGQTVSTNFSEDLNDDTRVDLEVSSFYVQDQIAINEHFDLVLGARYDRFDIAVVNMKSATNEQRTRVDTEVSPRLGAIYKPAENVSFYWSYSESFMPRSGEQYTDINGDKDKLKPDTFENNEIGLKWDLDSGLSLTTALFRNTQSSPQPADDDPATLDVVDSDIEGFEVQLSGQITESLSISSNYGYLKGEVVNRDGLTALTPIELPKNKASLWAQYEVNEQLEVGLGAMYQAKTFMNSSNSAFLPSYTRYDMYANYQLSHDYKLQLKLENLTDKVYFPNSHSTHQASVGQPFNAKLTFSGRF